jgi:hypothetical protein
MHGRHFHNSKCRFRQFYEFNLHSDEQVAWYGRLYTGRRPPELCAFITVSRRQGMVSSMLVYRHALTMRPSLKVRPLVS